MLKLKKKHSDVSLVLLGKVILPIILPDGWPRDVVGPRAAPNQMAQAVGVV